MAGTSSGTFAAAHAVGPHITRDSGMMTDVVERLQYENGELECKLHARQLTARGQHLQNGVVEIYPSW